MREQLIWERELLGIYLSQHPLQTYENILNEKSMPLNALSVDHEGESIVVGGTIASIREITTKSGQKMAFIKIEDRFGDIEAIVFPRTFLQTSELWERDRVVLIKGKLSTKDRNGKNGTDLKVMVDEAHEITIDQAAAYKTTGRKVALPKGKPLSSEEHSTDNDLVEPPEISNLVNERIYIRLTSGQDQNVLLSIKDIIDRAPGETDVVLVLGPADNKQIIKLPAKIDNHSEVLQSLELLVGTENIRIQ